MSAVSNGNPFVLALQLAETMRICAPTVLDASLGRLDRDICDRRLAVWADTALRLADAQVDVAGIEHLDPGRTHILMSNHQSAYDIFTLFVAFPYSMRMIAKKEMFRLPIMAGAMRAAEFVELDRSDRDRAFAALEAAKETMRSGINIWIAPEGTRSVDGALLPFKKGGFMMALQTEFSILPVTIDGTRDILPSKDFRVQKGRRARVTFHGPVDPGEYGEEGRPELMAEVRRRIDSALPAHLREA